jgi:hypothetical protein
MNFDEAVEAIEEMLGQDVEASVWGAGNDPSPVAFLHGVLERRALDPEVGALADELGESAVSYAVGDGAELALWPSRFVTAERVAGERSEVEVTTRDAVVRLALRSRPWID